MTTFRKKNCLTFDSTPGVEDVSVRKIFASMLLWSEPLLVANTTLLEISWCSSYIPCAMLECINFHNSESGCQLNGPKSDLNRCALEIFKMAAAGPILDIRTKKL